MSEQWNSDTAKGLLAKMPGTKQLNESSQKSYQFQISTAAACSKEIAIAIDRKNDVIAYLNQQSLTGQSYPAKEIEGISIVKLYPKGFKGKNGNPGIAGSVARLPSLDPASNDVMRVKVTGPDAFNRLVAWYTK